MDRVERDWEGRPKSKGLLHQHLQDEHDHNYRLNHVRYQSESYARLNYINRPFKTKIPHSANPDLRNKQDRSFCLSLIVNAYLSVIHNFNFCSRTLTVCLSTVLPAREARVIALAATVMIIVGLAFAAAKEVPLAFSAAAHTLHSRAVMHEMHELRALI